MYAGWLIFFGFLFAGIALNQAFKRRGGI